MYFEGLAVLFFASVLVGGVANWSKDLRDSLRDLMDPGPTESMALANQRYSFAKTIVLAVLADDHVSEEEWACLYALYEAQPAFEEDPREVVAELRRLAKSIRTRAQLEDAVRVCACDLTPEARAATYRIVEQLAKRGSGLDVESEGEGYRQAPRRDPEALLEVFRRALDVEVA
ncbi:MAG: hypothetical protein H6719_12500 [Sandaracinaceae bacterium]|nr:hypothetical protein [Sandaracinaceae bacterium]